MYGSELEDDEDEIEEEIRAREGAEVSGEISAKSTSEPTPQTAKEAQSPPTEEKRGTLEALHREGQNTTAAEVQRGGDEGGELVPKAAHNATSK
jgi:intermembrane space import and assembly protein 40